MQEADLSLFSYLKCWRYVSLIFTSHSLNISRIEKYQKSEMIGLMNENFESSTSVLQHLLGGNDTWSFAHPALHDNHSCSTKARTNYPACFTIYKYTAKMAYNPILKDQLLEW